MSASATPVTNAKTAKEKPMATESGPNWKWIAVGLFSVCGILIAVVWTTSVTGNAEVSATVQSHGERIAAVEAQERGSNERFKRIEQTLDRIENKVDHLSK